MFYSIVTLIYIIFIQAFIVRNFALNFVKLNYESRDDLKKNIKYTVLYLVAYLLIVGVRCTLQILTYKYSTFLLLDALCFFGFFALYSDAYKKNKKYWDFSKFQTLIFSILAVVLFITITVLLITLNDKIIMLVNFSGTSAALVVGGILLLLIAPMVVYLVLTLKKFKRQNNQTKNVDHEERLRQGIREQILNEEKNKQFIERIKAGDENAEGEREEWKKQLAEEKNVGVKKARFFTMGGKIALISFVILMLGINFIGSYFSGTKYFSIESPLISDVTQKLESSGYNITSENAYKFSYLIEKEFDYIDAKCITVIKDEYEVKIYFGRLERGDAITNYEEQIKKINALYTEGEGINMGKEKKTYTAFGTLKYGDEYVYTCYVRDEAIENSVDGFFFIVSKNHEAAYYTFKSIKNK